MDELPGKIAKWLEAQGYPFEMSVALQFQRAGFQVSLSDAYSDYESSTQREIDVSAIRWSDLEAHAALQVAARVECKTSKGKPWVVFVSQAQPEAILPIEVLCSSGCRVFFAELLKIPHAWKVLRGAPLLKPALLGHGIIQAFKDQQDVAYAAAFSSVKACVYRAMQFDSPEMFRATSGKRLLAAVCFPMIAIDTKLFECQITEAGAPTVREVDYSTLLWRGINPVNGAAMISVVTKKGLPALIDLFSATCDILNELVGQNIAVLESAVRDANASILKRHSPPTIE